MKRVWAFAVMSVLLVSMVSAAAELTGEAVNLGAGKGDNSENQDGMSNQGAENELGNQFGNVIQAQNKIQAGTGECPGNCTCTGSVTKCWLRNRTREMTVLAGASGNMILQVKGVNASTNVALYQSDDGKLYGVFKNNETLVVKSLPDQVRERIRERLSRELSDENITLAEDGAYQYQARNQAKLFGIFPVRERVTAEINSTNGEVIRLRKSWWAFLAGDAGEKIMGASCGTVTPGENTNCCINKGYDFWNEETLQCEFTAD